MKALITGIEGFAGTHLAEHLLACGDAVFGCAKFGAWGPDAPTAVRDNCHLAAWDLAESLPAPTRGAICEFAPDCVFHLAAISAPAECGSQSPNEIARAINVEGTRRVLELAISLPARPRLLLVSSSKVYAPVASSGEKTKEVAPAIPADGYGKTKLEAEKLVLAAAAGGELDTVVVRAFQHTGPRQAPIFMLPQWARQLAGDEKKPLEVQNLDSFLDLSDVRDVVRAYRLLAAGRHNERIFNIGSGVERRSGEILELLLSAAGIRPQVVETSPGRRQNPIADIARVSEATGWRPTIPIQSTVQDTLEYWRREESR